MAETRPTKINFWHACYLCILCVTNPKAFMKHHERDNSKRNQFDAFADRKPSGVIVCRAFWFSFLLVVISVAIGYAFGIAVGKIHPSENQCLVAVLQILGAFLLLWGALFVRGWEIQTFCGVTLAERVNQWLYRGLYCVGTILLVCSLTLP